MTEPASIPLDRDIWAWCHRGGKLHLEERRATALGHISGARPGATLFKLEDMQWVPKIYIPEPTCCVCGFDRVGLNPGVGLKVVTKAKFDPRTQFACEPCYARHFADDAEMPIERPKEKNPDSFCLVPGESYYAKPAKAPPKSKARPVGTKL